MKIQMITRPFVSANDLSWVQSDYTKDASSRLCPSRSENDTLPSFESMLDVYYGPAILITGQMSSGWPNFTIFSHANDLRCVQLDDVEVFC